MQPIYVPGGSFDNPFSQLLKTPDPVKFAQNYQYDVSPVSDDRPFFFYTVQPQDLWNFLTTSYKGSADYKINRAVPLLYSLLLVSLVATIVILALPPMVLGTRLPREKGVRSFLMYFICIGAGYILIQVALIQKFVLFLGHPTYALTVIVFSMLLFSGLGSYWSRRVVESSESKLQKVLAAVAACVTLLALISAPVTTALVGLPLPLKALITALLIAPAGFLMGMPFPTGMSRLERFHKPSVRWAWSLNAASSVLGSASAIFFAIYFGLRATLLLGGFLYLLALISVRISARAQQSSASNAIPSGRLAS